MGDFYDMIGTNSWFVLSSVQEFIDEYDCYLPDEVPEGERAELAAAKGFKAAADKVCGGSDGVVVPESDIEEYAKYEAQELWTPQIVGETYGETLKTSFDWSKGPFEYIDWATYTKSEYTDRLPEVTWQESGLWEGSRTFYIDTNE